MATLRKPPGPETLMSIPADNNSPIVKIHCWGNVGSYDSTGTRLWKLVPGLPQTLAHVPFVCWFGLCPFVEIDHGHEDKGSLSPGSLLGKLKLGCSWGPQNNVLNMSLPSHYPLLPFH